MTREKKEKFYELKNSDNKYSEPIATNNNGNGIIQERLSRKERIVKVHSFRGATVDDMKHQVIPLLYKEPNFIIIHAGTKAAPYLTSRKILNNFLTLKSFITYNLPNCKVVIFTPILLTDDGKQRLQ